jgi:hypothetical protein
MGGEHFPGTRERPVFIAGSRLNDPTYFLPFLLLPCALSFFFGRNIMCSDSTAIRIDKERVLYPNVNAYPVTPGAKRRDRRWRSSWGSETSV